jgi:Rrf2 family transcriptional regulator, cysteine metabolism repressor
MKVSTKGRYGLRAMVDLAVYGSGEHVSLYSIAERQSISPSYLEQVFSILRKSGLVQSVKGAQGGYKLMRDPAKITAKEVLAALEGELAIVDGSDSDVGQDLIKKAINELVWNRLNDNLNRIFESVTLEDMANDYKKQKGLLPIMFHI